MRRTRCGESVLARIFRAVFGAEYRAGFEIEDELADRIREKRAFIQLTNGPYDLDLVYAPDGIDNYEGARWRAVETTKPRTAKRCRGSRTSRGT